jgi:hypothetical protein
VGLGGVAANEIWGTATDLFVLTEGAILGGIY